MVTAPCLVPPTKVGERGTVPAMLWVASHPRGPSWLCCLPVSGRLQHHLYWVVVTDGFSKLFSQSVCCLEVKWSS